MSGKTFNGQFRQLDKTMRVLKAIAHPVRLSMVRLISENEEVNVNQIYTDLKLEQSITSQHLKVLRDTEFVNTRRDGKYIYYQINKQKLASIGDKVNAFMESGRS